MILRIAIALSLLLVLIHSERAYAQSVRVAGKPVLTNASGEPAAHSANLPAGTVDYDDCIADESLRFPLALDAPLPAGTSLEVWAGEGTTDCTSIANRSPEAAQCWPVGTVIPVDATSMRVDLRVQDAIAQFGHAVKTASTHGTPSDCGALPVGPHTVSIQFVPVTGGNAVGTSAAYSLVAATSFSASTNDFTVAGGDRTIRLDLLDTPDPSVTGYDVYCDPLPVSAAGDDAGAPCSSSKLVAQKGPYGEGKPYPGPPPTALRCGQVAPGDTTATITGLTNGVTYAIALTETDAYDNQGYASDTQCATPYAGARGASAASGGCAMARAPQGTGLASVVLGFVAAAILRIRRRRGDEA